jgi:ketosteroid isomerase-like protein
MSPGTVEFVRRFFDAFDRHDEPALLALTDPELAFSSLIVEVEGGFHGHEGLRLYLSELFTSFPDMRIAIEGVRPVGEGAVVKLRVEARGATSGASTALTDWQAMAIRDGKAIWWAFFRSESEAVAAIEARRRQELARGRGTRAK